MKKSIFILVATIMSCIYSCSKEESNSGISGCVLSDTTLVGSWGITKIEVGGRDTTATIFQFMPCYKALVTEFKATKIVSETNTGKDIFGQPCTKEANKNWNLIRVNSKDYLVVYNSTQSDTSWIESFNCTSMTASKNGMRVTFNKK